MFFVEKTPSSRSVISETCHCGDNILELFLITNKLDGRKTKTAWNYNLVTSLLNNYSKLDIELFP